MVIELFEAGAAALELGVDGLLLSPFESSRYRASILGSIATGAVAGLVMQDKMQATLTSTALGAVIPIISMKNASLGSVAMCAITSGAMGYLANGVKRDWQHRHEEKKKHVAEHAPRLAR